MSLPFFFHPHVIHHFLICSTKVSDKPKLDIYFIQCDLAINPPPPHSPPGSPLKLITLSKIGPWFSSSWYLFLEITLRQNNCSRQHQWKLGKSVCTLTFFFFISLQCVIALRKINKATKRKMTVRLCWPVSVIFLSLKPTFCLLLSCSASFV